MTALQMAIMNGKNWVIDLLLELGANLDLEFFYAKAIHAACAKNNTQALQMLIERGANVNALYQAYLNPLAAAVYFGSISCLEHLLLVSGVNEMPLISKAIISDLPETVQMVVLLLANGADANAYASAMNERLPIIDAAKRERWDVVSLLLEHTQPIQGVTWDVEGLAKHVRSADFKAKDLADKKKNCAALKARLMFALRRKIYMTAEICCKALKYETDDEVKWDNLYHLCQYCKSSAATGGEVTLTSNAICGIGQYLLFEQKDYSKAVVALKAALALQPDNAEAIRFLKLASNRSAEVGTSGRS